MEFLVKKKKKYCISYIINKVVLEKSGCLVNWGDNEKILERLFLFYVGRYEGRKSIFDVIEKFFCSKLKLIKIKRSKKWE